MTAVSLSFAALNIDCADPAAPADFWGEGPRPPRQPRRGRRDAAIDATDPASAPG